MHKSRRGLLIDGRRAACRVGHVPADGTIVRPVFGCRFPFTLVGRGWSRLAAVFDGSVWIISV